jgi:hypothetical protein
MKKLGARVIVADVLRHSPENIHNEFAKRNAESLALIRDPNAICNLGIQRTRLAEGEAGREQTVGPMLYSMAYSKVRAIF